MEPESARSNGNQRGGAHGALTAMLAVAAGEMTEAELADWVEAHSRAA